jgi:hypothetical protein
MSTDTQPAVIEMCANRFELISRWGEPVDKEWARRMLDRWLDQRVDLTQASVYDSGVQAKGTDHG